MPTGVIFVISAPSGAGKSTIIEKIRPLFPDMLYSISYTTRPRRNGEIDGVHYHFVTEERFRKMIEADCFLEWKEVHGNLYGTHAHPVIEAFESGKRMILDIDVEGAKEVFKNIHNVVGIFILPPDMDTLEKRLRLRGTDSEETIRLRIAKAPNEIGAAHLFTHRVVNDDLDTAVRGVASILRKESDADAPTEAQMP